MKDKFIIAAGVTITPPASPVITVADGRVAIATPIVASPQYEYAISGVCGIADATITLDTGETTTSTGGTGAYTISGLTNGTYTVTPTKTGSNFSPSSQDVTVQSANQTGIDFTTSANTITVTITGEAKEGVTVTCTGFSPGTTNASGVCIFSGVTNGAKTLGYSKTGCYLSPSSSSITFAGIPYEVTGIIALRNDVTGAITGTAKSGVTVALGALTPVTTGADGLFSFTAVPNDTYELVATKEGYLFTNNNQNIVVLNDDEVAVTMEISSAVPAYITLTIDQTKIDAALTDFPVLVKLTAANFYFSSSRADGYDVYFAANSNGTTPYKFERVSHDQAGETAEYWVKIPSISDSVDTVFYLIFGNLDATDTADPTNVWDASSQAVWHLKDNTTSQILDSTANVRHGAKTSANNPVEATGIIGKGQSFDGTDTITITPAYTHNMSLPWSSSGWVYIPSATVSGTFHIMHSGIGVGNGTWDSVGNHLIGLVGSVRWIDTLADMSVGWHHYAICCTDMTDPKIYLDGTDLGNFAGTGSSATGTDEYLGSSGASRQLSSGCILDEMRISSVKRSAAWVKAEYNTGNDSLITYS